MKKSHFALACAVASIVLAQASQGQASIVNPALGDFDGNYLVNHDDIDLLAEAAHAWSIDPSDPSYDFDAFDLNDDGKVTFAVGADASGPNDPDEPGDFFSDSNVLIRDILATDYGDANLDGAVFLDDLAIFASNYQGLGPLGWANGNFDGSQEDGITTSRVFLGDLAAMAIMWSFDDGVGAIDRVVVDGVGAIEVLSPPPVDVNPEPLSFHVWLVGVFLTYHFTRRSGRAVSVIGNVNAAL
jgi:hypothetical protein